MIRFRGLYNCNELNSLLFSPSCMHFLSIFNFGWTTIIFPWMLLSHANIFDSWCSFQWVCSRSLFPVPFSFTHPHRLPGVVSRIAFKLVFIYTCDCCTHYRHLQAVIRALWTTLFSLVLDPDAEVMMKMNVRHHLNRVVEMIWLHLSMYRQQNNQLHLTKLMRPVWKKHAMMKIASMDPVIRVALQNHSHRPHQKVRTRH